MANKNLPFTVNKTLTRAIPIKLGGFIHTSRQIQFFLCKTHKTTCKSSLQIISTALYKPYGTHWMGGRVRFNASVLKTDEGASPPGVRIPPHPPFTLK